MGMRNYSYSLHFQPLLLASGFLESLGIRITFDLAIESPKFLLLRSEKEQLVRMGGIEDWRTVKRKSEQELKSKSP